MASNLFGQPDFTVRRTTVSPTSAVQRTGSATEREQQRNPRQERRDRNPPNPQRRRLYDLLFDEVDRFDGLDEPQRARLKSNLRAHLTARPPPATPPPAHEADGETLTKRLLESPSAGVPVDHDHIVQAAVGGPAEATPEDAADNAILARQLRDCLARNTDQARKIAVYLHLLLTIDGALRPHTIMDV
ncbi:hypothetical protein [Azospirillum agricola]|uniref:hypothetical protein n=1 Tax=Azospirillum agricola TaxID=1720247 RepID=UPI000A0EF334|nr:hypothetical protein [Azospirillum agricola]SMH58809.1 hypothetical protein SAMN02982994_4775 [Azospirillum lipoferum]